MEEKQIDPTVLKFMEVAEGPYDLTFRCRVCGERMSVCDSDELLPLIDAHHKKSPACLYRQIF
jgi:hypothetical protein